METIKSFCRYCNSETYQQKVIRPIGPHYGEILCVVCNKRTSFIPKPKNENLRPKNKYSPADLGVNYCQMCLRSKEDMINHETLEIHHIIQVASGGEDRPENIWVVCTPCHKMIHHSRFYLRRASGDYSY